MATGQEAADTGGSNLLPLLLLGLLLFLLLLAILYVWNRRRALLEGGEAGEPEYSRAAPVTKSTRPSMTGGSSTTAAAAPATVALPAEPMAVPIARFRTAYTRGHDTYDDAFSIENANGDFLGECGVGISETLGATATALSTPPPSAA